LVEALENGILYGGDFKGETNSKAFGLIPVN
jgi:hypothetical protein